VVALFGGGCNLFGHGSRLITAGRDRLRDRATLSGPARGGRNLGKGFDMATKSLETAFTRTVSLHELTNQFADDHVELSHNSLTDDLLSRAFGYWLGYPTFLEIITNGHENERCAAVNYLKVAHFAATRRIMEAAEIAGLDSGPLWVGHEVCQRALRHYRGPDISAVNDHWPHCLGDAINDLADNDVRAIRDCDALIGRLSARVDKKGVAAVLAGGESGEAAERLFGWPEILDAIKRPNDETGRMKQLNAKFGGPIVTRQGGEPLVERAELINWWNSLQNRVAESQRRRTDASATLADSHPYGKRGATVLPGIGGQIKTRRSNEKT
jgi:hypothetical protein